MPRNSEQRDGGVAKGMAEVKGRFAHWMTFSSVMLGMASQGLTFTAFSPALSAIAKDFNQHGHGGLIAQQCLTIASGGLFFGAFVSGRIISRFGARRTALVAIMAFGLFGAGGLFLSNPLILLASRVIVGFSSACLTTACFTILAVLYDGQARARAVGIASAMASISALFGLIVGGALAQSAGWRAAFVQYPVFAVAGFAIAIVGLPTLPVAENATGGSGRLGLGIWINYGLSMVLMAVLFLGSSQFAFLLPTDGVIKPTDISLVLSLVTVTSAIAGFAFPTAKKYLGLPGTLIAAILIEAAALIIIGAIQSAAAACIGAVLMGLYVGSILPFFYESIIAQTNAVSRPGALGLLNAFYSLGGFINPYLFAPLITGFGYHGLFVVAGSAMAIFGGSGLIINRLRAPALR